MYFYFEKSFADGLKKIWHLRTTHLFVKKFSTPTFRIHMLVDLVIMNGCDMRVQTDLIGLKSACPSSCRVIINLSCVPPSFCSTKIEQIRVNYSTHLTSFFYTCNHIIFHCIGTRLSIIAR